MKKDKIYPGKFLGLLLLSACFAACAVFGGRLFRAGLEYKRQEADLLRMRRLTGGRKEDIGQAGAEMTGQNAEKGADRAAVRWCREEVRELRPLPPDPRDQAGDLRHSPVGAEPLGPDGTLAAQLHAVPVIRGLPGICEGGVICY